MSAQTKQDAGQASFIVARIWGADYADLLSVFNGEQVDRALLAAFTTTHREDEGITYEQLCRTMVDLIDRKVLVPEFHNDLADEQLADMREKATYAPPAPPVDPEVKAQTDRDAEIAQCARDFHAMSGTAFKSKWLGVKRDVYEAAFSRGLI